jgi:glycosyltransferase involved in cell wall biosynthesis
MVGRIAPQKDPKYFTEVARWARNYGGDFEFVWVGDGEKDFKKTLLDSGVKITGWKDRKGVEKELMAADIYVHTAAWEGFPVTILDAAKIGLPILARRADYLEGMPRKYIYAEPYNLASKLVSLTRDDWEKAKRSAKDWGDALKDNTMDNLREVLLGIYDELAKKS